MRRDAGQGGFTLIEVLISITLLAMLGTLIANGTRLGTRAWSSAERQTADKDEIILVQGLLRRTLVRAVPLYDSNDPRSYDIRFGGEADRLSLTAPQPGTQFAGPLVVQRFYIGRHGASQALFASIEPLSMVADTAQAKPGQPVVLLDRVAEARFVYFGGQQGSPPAWQDSWTNRTRLPELIRVMIRRDDAKLPVWPELVVATRATANAACLYDDFATSCRRGSAP